MNMTKKPAPTPKSRLRGEFNSGDTYADIANRLNAEGLHRSLLNGELRPWSSSEVARAMVGLGLRRNKVYETSKRMVASAPVATRSTTTRAKNKSAPQVLASINALLSIDTIDPAERITLALMAIEGAGYGS